MERYVRPSVAEDVAFIADNMREGDREEVAAFNHTPFESLSLGLETSTVCYTLIDFQGTPFAMMGVAPSPLPDAGLIWMLGTKGIEEIKITFLRHCKPVLEKMYETSNNELLYNYTYADNTVHHQWLKWLGFSFLREVKLPPNGKTFYEFARLKENTNV